MFSLNDKISIVTGAASGIGQSIAQCFARAGAFVYVIDRDASAESGTVASIRHDGGQAQFLQLDITDEGACNRTVQAILAERGGQIDVLVNNAGIGKVGTILQTTAEDMDRLFAVNVKGAFHLSRAVLPAMIARKRGSIINIASLAGLISIPERFAYCTSKFAVVGMTKAMALDHSDTQVRINCICPGRIDTPFVQGLLKQYPDPEVFRRKMVAGHAIGRLGRPDEIAAAALYLAADESAFVTGSSLVIDGGYTAGK